MAWVLVSIVDRKIQRVASLIIQHNDLASWVVRKRLRVIAVLVELLGLLIREPMTVSPQLGQIL